MDKSPSKPVRNTLLQTASFGLPVENIPATFFLPVAQEPVDNSASLLPKPNQSSSQGNHEPSSNTNLNTSQRSVPLVTASQVPSEISNYESLGMANVDITSAIPLSNVTPTQATALPSLSQLPVTNTSSNNNFRLGTKRPTYAPIPGLSTSSTSSSNIQHPNFATLDSSQPQPQLLEIQNMAQPSTILSYNVDNGNTISKVDLASESQVTDNTQTGSNLTSYFNNASQYRPAYHHWFYKKVLTKKWYNSKDKEQCKWIPFSMGDSLALESAFNSHGTNENSLIPTDGGRYDVNVLKREKVAVYWDEAVNVVRRCSWFSKSISESIYTPYDEEVSMKLEEEYKIGVTTSDWPRRIDYGKDEIIMHTSTLMTQQQKMPHFHILDGVNETPSPLNPRAVKRGGFDDFEIEDDEPEKIDHLLFVVHGIGQFCDLKMRGVIEVVDEFRKISIQLTQSHFEEASTLGEVNRIEILPVSWHKALHCDDTGVDSRLKNITLPSVPKMREFANDTILDVLFYSSPVYSQIIIDTVATEMNRLYALFRSRNPSFNGSVSVGGHSLGSLILFDILSNQPIPSQSPVFETAHERMMNKIAEQYNQESKVNDSEESRKISIVAVGKAGTGQPVVRYPKMDFTCEFFFAFGSPIGCFIATRSEEILGETFKFPTCKHFFNIFHPFDPVAYRMEPLIVPSLNTVKPVQIPHHKGRKRMHLELKETVSNVGQKLVNTVKNTWNAMFHVSADKMGTHNTETHQKLDDDDHSPQNSESISYSDHNNDLMGSNITVGQLNGGKRIDYVLQEAPMEYFNEYLFALTSHLCYWTSRDTILMVLKEMYAEVETNANSSSPIQNVLPFDITTTSSDLHNTATSLAFNTVDHVAELSTAAATISPTLQHNISE